MGSDGPGVTLSLVLKHTSTQASCVVEYKNIALWY
jgi:hypothetical protein